MQEMNPEAYFYVCDGTVIRSIEEFFEALQEMPDNVFSHHVNHSKNDFHTWIKDVFDNKILAKNLEMSRTKDDFLKHVFVSLFR